MKQQLKGEFHLFRIMARFIYIFTMLETMVFTFAFTLLSKIAYTYFILRNKPRRRIDFSFNTQLRIYTVIYLSQISGYHSFRCHPYIYGYNTILHFSVSTDSYNYKYFALNYQLW